MRRLKSFYLVEWIPLGYEEVVNWVLAIATGNAKLSAQYRANGFVTGFADSSCEATSIDLR